MWSTSGRLLTTPWTSFLRPTPSPLCPVRRHCWPSSTTGTQLHSAQLHMWYTCGTCGTHMYHRYICVLWVHTSDWPIYWYTWRGCCLAGICLLSCRPLPCSLIYTQSKLSYKYIILYFCMMFTFSSDIVVKGIVRNFGHRALFPNESLETVFNTFHSVLLSAEIAGARLAVHGNC